MTRIYRQSLTLALVLLGVAVVLSGCLRLDGFFYYPTKAASYELGAFTGAELYDVNNFLPDSSIAGHFQQVPIPAPDGNTIYAYLLQHTVGAPTTTILYCHGNAHNIDTYWERAKLFYYYTGADVLIFDYEGYGMSGGSPSETALVQDGTAALDYLTKTLSPKVPMSSIILYGYSLGSVPAVWLAANYPGANGPSGARGLMLESPVGSAALFVQNATDLPLPADTVTNLVIDNAEQIKTVTIPYYWLGGDHDSTIRYDTQGQAVYDNYGGAYKFKTIIAGADHSTIPVVLGGTNYSVYGTLVGNFVNNPKVQP